MKSNALILVAGLVAAAVGCGPATSLNIALTDDPAVVSNGAGDRLCVLTVSSIDAPLASTEIKVWLTPVGGTTSQMPFQIADTNENGLLDAGETITVIEPPVNLIGTAQIGMPFAIEVLRDLGTSRVSSLWEGNWTAQ